MAERLAPEQLPLRVTSRPEQVRVRKHRALRRTVLVLLAAVVAVAAGLVTLRLLAVDRQAEDIRPTALVPPDMPATVLVVLARPGQELTMAGTLAALDEAGATVSLLSLTRGESQPPDLSSAQVRLASLRAQELQASADVLGVDRVRTAAFADGSLIRLDPARVTDRISEEIAAVSPSTLLTVSDVTGEDSDSQAVAAYALAAAQQPDSTVARIWTVTRGAREVSWNERLARPVGERLPAPQVSVRIGGHAAAKGDALLAHGTQSPDLAASTYPYSDRVPSWAYYRFWDREYFALAWGTPHQA